MRTSIYDGIEAFIVAKSWYLLFGVEVFSL